MELSVETCFLLRFHESIKILFLVVLISSTNDSSLMLYDLCVEYVSFVVLTQVLEDLPCITIIWIHFLLFFYLYTTRLVECLLVGCSWNSEIHVQILYAHSSTNKMRILKNQVKQTNHIFYILKANQTNKFATLISKGPILNFY